jgi:hypothetical protein
VVDANAPRAADSGSRAQDNNTPGTQRSTADSNATQDSNVTRPPGTVDSQKPADVLTMHHSEWANDPVAQRTLFEAAGAAVERMKQVARTVAGDLPGAEVSSLRKRDSLDSFVEKVLEKQRSKGYGSISDMSDIIRGRFNLDSAADMDTVAARLKEAFKGDIVEIKPPRDGYPRWHINVRDAETGLVHEWQVGTKATTDFFERESLSIPKTIQNFDGRPNFHDGVYKLLNKIKDPAVRAAYGLDDMMVGYKQLTEETGRVTREQSFPTDYEKRYQAMADQISATIARIEAERPGYLDSVLAGGGGGH